MLGSANNPSSKFSVPSPTVIVGVGASKSAIIEYSYSPLHPKTLVTLNIISTMSSELAPVSAAASVHV